MTALSSKQLEQGILTNLKSDTALLTLLGGAKLYDEPRRNAHFLTSLWLQATRATGARALNRVKNTVSQLRCGPAPMIANCSKIYGRD